MIVRLNEEDLKRELAIFASRLGSGRITQVYGVQFEENAGDSLIELVLDDPKSEADQ
jgi:hypothetical protein